MIKVFFYKIAYQFYSLLSRVTKRQKHIKQKFLFASLIIAVISISSCRLRQPHKCYSPVMPPDDVLQENSDTSSSNIDIRIKKTSEFKV